MSEVKYKHLTTVLYRSLERLSLAIEQCAKIGFEESKPTTNEMHGEIWIGLNEAQADAKLKLKLFQNIVASIVEADARQPEAEEEK